MPHRVEAAFSKPRSTTPVEAVRGTRRLEGFFANPPHSAAKLACIGIKPLWGGTVEGRVVGGDPPNSSLVVDRNLVTAAGILSTMD
uniref:Uncharacterized protein n=1 Tax=Oryza punctata TaxID=4537 RepID=A0A0E0L5Y3_ORYPU